MDDQEDDDDFPDDETASIAPSFTSNFSTSSRMSLMSHASAIPEVSREDFDAILDDFLDNYEVVGSKYRLSLGGTALSGPEKLRVLRDAIEDENEGLGKEENRRRIMEIERMGRGVKGVREKRERVKSDKEENQWDVETILSECNSRLVF
jgi:protein LTV1